MTITSPPNAALLPLFLSLALCLFSAVAAGGAELRRSASGLPGLPLSAAVEGDDFVYLAGALGTLPGSRSLADGVEAQTRQTFENLEATLAGLGLDRTRIVELRIFLPDLRFYPAVDAEIGRRFGAAPPTVAVAEAALALPGAEVEIAAVAAKAGVAIEALTPAGWRPPPMHFRHALRAGGAIFLSGQVGVDMKTGSAVPGGTAAQARQAFDNVRQLLEAAGSSLGEVAGCRVFLADARDFSQLNEVWNGLFTAAPPVRETLQGKLGAPDLRIEVHCYAVGGERRAVEPSGEKPAGQPYSTAIAAGGRLYTSGMVARTAGGWTAGGVRDQTRAVLAKLAAVLEKAGAGPQDVMDATVVLAHPSYYEAMNEEYRQFFPAALPARITVVQPLMSAEGLVEISFVVRLPAPPAAH